MDSGAGHVILEAPLDRMPAKDAGKYIIERVGSTGGNDWFWRSAVSELRVEAAEAHLRQVGWIGYPGHLGQIRFSVESVITLIPVQIAQGEVIRHDR